MTKRQGVLIENVTPGSEAERAGIREGDVLLTVNGDRVSDVIDYMFHASGPELRLALNRNGRKVATELSLPEGRDSGIELNGLKTRTCGNNCMFCFVSQLPRGLRKSLYIKDDDYRMSFLHGNYITLSGLSAEDKKRIARQRLSPLYISVHTTNRELRNRMLGNPKAPDIMKELRYLKDNRIHMHAQIVLCPDVNDGGELKKTIRDLYSFHPYLESIAVVPVGITSHSRSALRPVGKKDAEEALAAIEAFQKRFRKKHGDPIVYAADELYITASRPFPTLKEYGELPQIENGVGMVPLFLSQAKSLSPPKSKAKPRALAITGVSFYPYLRKFTERIGKYGVSITPVRVENSFFGSSVTVAGLLTGRDVIKALSGISGNFDLLLIPDPVLKEGEEVFLDDVAVSDIEDALGIKTAIIEPTPEGLIKGVLENEDKRKD
jgi:putative radical SAM enzyme (TIGR03279 family)